MKDRMTFTPSARMPARPRRPSLWCSSSRTKALLYSSQRSDRNDFATTERIVMKIVVIGGSGLIGSQTVRKLRDRGLEVVAASPRSGVNAVTGEGLDQALKGAQVVVDVANAPVWEDDAVMKFFDTST